MTVVKRFQHPLERGIITATCANASFAVVATELGILSLWDLRFGLLVKSWRASRPVTSAQFHPARGKGLWVILGLRRQENSAPILEVHDIETSRVVEVFEIRQTKPSSRAPVVASSSHLDDSIPSKQELIARLAQVEDPPSRHDDAESAEASGAAAIPSVLALTVGNKLQSMAAASRDGDGSLLMSVPEGGALGSATAAPPGFVVTAGEDRVVRYWDLVKPSEGMVVCGSPKEKGVVFRRVASCTTVELGLTEGSRQSAGSQPALLYTLPASASRTAGTERDGAGGGSARSVAAVDKTAVAQMQRQPFRPHYDAICALGTVETSSSSCVISADRSGVIKVWRLEAGGASGKA